MIKNLELASDEEITNMAVLYMWKQMKIKLSYNKIDIDDVDYNEVESLIAHKNVGKLISMEA